MGSWAELEVVRDADLEIDEMWIAVDVAATAEVAERRARAEYGDPDYPVPVASGRVWMHERPVDWDDDEDVGFADEYCQETIVDECSPDLPGAREFWCVLGVDPSEVEMVRGELAEREKGSGDAV